MSRTDGGRRGRRGSAGLRGLAAAVLGVGVMLAPPLGATPAQAAPGDQVCTGGVGGTCTVTDVTPGDETWVVPAGVNQVSFTVDGARGGEFPDSGPAGLGGEVAATLATAAGTSLVVSVGGAGNAVNEGGYNGGGDGGGSTTGGGGYSAVLAGSTYLIVAGGGGGADTRCDDVLLAGGSGGEVGQPGTGTCGVITGGGGGTADAGGAGGNPTGKPGAHLLGGGGFGGSQLAGAGGGGGWYGGGQGGGGFYLGNGTFAAGGGGSSHVEPGLTNVSYITGARAGNGRIVITYPNPVGANDSAVPGPSNTPITGAVDATGPTRLTVTSATGPAHGTVTFDGTAFSYTPAADYVGTDTFTYRATDTDGDYAVGTVTVRVNAVVTFDSRGGTPTPEPQVVPPGDPASAPAEPTKDGYVFAGWWTEADAGARWNFGDPVTANLTLYAHWTALITVTFDAAGGTPVPAAQTIPAGTAATEPTPPTLTNDTFDGWYTTAIGGTRWTFADPVSADLTLHAQFTGAHVSPDTVIQGRTLTITGTGFQPGEDVEAVLRSDPVTLGVQPADATGQVVFTTTVPDTFDTGQHQATLTGQDSGRTATDAFQVTTAPPTTAPTTTPTTPTTPPPTTRMTTTPAAPSSSETSAPPTISPSAPVTTSQSTTRTDSSTPPPAAMAPPPSVDTPALPATGASAALLPTALIALAALILGSTCLWWGRRNHRRRRPAH